MDWVASRDLWVAKGDGSEAHSLAGAGSGVYQPVWSKDGSHILYVRDNALWLIAADKGEAEKILDLSLGEEDQFGFYGYENYNNGFAWFQP